MPDAGDAARPLSDSAQRIRDAAKYLVAAFGAVGAVLISGLSLTALPTGRHPVIAVLAVVVAVLAIGLAIALVVRVIVPEQMTLSQLAKLQGDHPDDKLSQFLDHNPELFQGLGGDLQSFRQSYLEALDKRAETFEAQLANIGHQNQADFATAAQVASARVQFLYPAIAQLLEVAVFFQLKRRFARSWALIALAAGLVAVAAGVYSWASSKPAETNVPLVNCSAYYLNLDSLADDEPSLTAVVAHNQFPLDNQARACGFRSRAELNQAIAYLAHK